MVVHQYLTVVEKPRYTEGVLDAVKGTPEHDPSAAGRAEGNHYGLLAEWVVDDFVIVQNLDGTSAIDAM